MTAYRNVVGRVNEDHPRLGAVQHSLKRCSLGRISAEQAMLTPFYILSESCDNRQRRQLSTAEGDPTMNFVDQLDPELRVVVEKLPTDRPLDLNKIPAARVKMNKMVTALLAGLPAVEGVTSQ